MILYCIVLCNIIQSYTYPITSAKNNPQKHPMFSNVDEWKIHHE